MHFSPQTEMKLLAGSRCSEVERLLLVTSKRQPPAKEQLNDDEVAVTFSGLLMVALISAQYLASIVELSNHNAGEDELLPMGTPLFHVAVTCVAESATTESAAMPSYEAFPAWPEVKKFVPVNTIVVAVSEIEVTAGNAAPATCS